MIEPDGAVKVSDTMFPVETRASGIAAPVGIAANRRVFIPLIAANLTVFTRHARIVVDFSRFWSLPHKRLVVLLRAVRRVLIRVGAVNVL